MITGKDPKFFDAAGSSTFSWDTYLACRPDYEQSGFYDVIWDYHDQHHGEWKIAYDVGTGPGNVAKVLAGKFEWVHASDIAAANVEEAKRRYHQLQNVDFQQGRAEDVSGPPANLITVAECLPLMDVDVAMGTFAKILQPGGTLAIWFYGGPIFTDPGSGEVQQLQRDIAKKSYDVIRKDPPSWAVIASWFDNVKIPPEHWKDVKRIKWNSDRPLGFSTDFEEGLHLASAIQPDEAIERRAKREFWRKEVDFEWAKGFIDALVPRTKSYITPEVEDMYVRLEKLMAGKKWTITWPVVSILATRK